MNSYQHVRLYEQELEALSELPHMHRCLYILALKPYIDYATCIVGEKRAITWQSIRESLYIRPRRGIKHDDCSKDQLRRAVKQLEKEGLIKVHSKKSRLIFELPLATQDTYIQNKAAILSLPETNDFSTSQNNKLANLSDFPKLAKATIPLKINNINIYKNKKNYNKKKYNLTSSNLKTTDLWFEAFWQAYPIKKSKPAALKIFAEIVSDEAMLKTLLDAITAQQQAREHLAKLRANGQAIFIPAWKYPVTWLNQQGWLDDVSEIYQVQASESFSVQRTSIAVDNKTAFPLNTDFDKIEYRS